MKTQEIKTKDNQYSNAEKKTIHLKQHIWSDQLQ